MGPDNRVNSFTTVPGATSSIRRDSLKKLQLSLKQLGVVGVKHQRPFNLAMGPNNAQVRCEATNETK